MPGVSAAQSTDASHASESRALPRLAGSEGVHTEKVPSSGVLASVMASVQR